jgi:hypothetical protein
MSNRNLDKTGKDFYPGYRHPTKTENAIHPFKTQINGQNLRIRINDFPEEHFATVVDADNKPILHTNDLLSNWVLEECSAAFKP